MVDIFCKKHVLEKNKGFLDAPNNQIEDATGRRIAPIRNLLLRRYEKADGIMSIVFYN